MPQSWIVGDGTQAIGPLTTQQLKALAAEGKITPETLVRTTTMTSPVPARRVQGLFTASPGTVRVAPTSPTPPPTSTLEQIELPPIPTAPPAPEPIAEPQRNGLGIPIGESLFKEDPTPPREPRTRRFAPAPSLMTAAPVQPPTHPLAQPRWQDLWPLALIMIGFGWIAGLCLESRFFEPDSVISILMIGLAAVPLCMAAFLFWLRPRQMPTGTAIGVGMFTGIGGVLALLALQWCASMVAGAGRLRFYGKGTIILVILFAIGWAYNLTNADNVFLRWLGFVFGVGLCEETVKMLALVWLLLGTAHLRMGLHTFMAIGFASGMGFGISEALYIYNPWHGDAFSHMPGAGSNLIRWFALVPSHGLWTAMCAGFLWKRQAQLEAAEGFWWRSWEVAKAAGLMALLHGTYDTICSLGYVAAMLFDGVMFGVLVWLTRRFTLEEADPATVVPRTEPAITHRQPILGGWMGAAAVLTVLALLGTVNESEYDQHMVKERIAAVRELLPQEYRPYLDHVDPVAHDGETGPVHASFSADIARLADGLPIVGTFSNTGSEELHDVVITCTDEEGNQSTFTRPHLAVGAAITLDADKEWVFMPGEQVDVSWAGHEQPVHFVLP